MNNTDFDHKYQIGATVYFPDEDILVSELPSYKVIDIRFCIKDEILTYLIEADNNSQDLDVRGAQVGCGEEDLFDTKEEAMAEKKKRMLAKVEESIKKHTDIVSQNSQIVEELKDQKTQIERL